MTLSSEPSDALASPVPAIPAEEAEVLRKAVAGNISAFEQLVRTHTQRVFNLIYQKTRHRQDSEDLCQQTFIKAYRNIHRVDPTRPLIPWLLTIAHRTTLNHFRGAKQWTELAPETPSNEASPARQAEHDEHVETLWGRARRILPKRDFDVLWLRLGEEMSVDETAAATGLTQSHVKVIVHRARQQLMKGEPGP
jgi:RNA polymerase sigma-70 factor (ECF subfamily)